MGPFTASLKCYEVRSDCQPVECFWSNRICLPENKALTFVAFAWARELYL